MPRVRASIHLKSRLFAIHQCNTLNLNLQILRQGLDSHAAPGRLMREVSLINLIELVEMIHVTEKHCAFHHFADIASRLGQDRLDALTARPRFVCDTPLERAPIGIDGNLA